MCPSICFIFHFRLYNKDAIIEYLLDKSAERPNAEAVTHIRGMKVSSRCLFFLLFVFVFFNLMQICYLLSDLIVGHKGFDLD